MIVEEKEKYQKGEGWRARGENKKKNNEERTGDEIERRDGDREIAPVTWLDRNRTWDVGQSSPPRLFESIDPHCDREVEDSYYNCQSYCTPRQKDPIHNPLSSTNAFYFHLQGLAQSQSHYDRRSTEDLPKNLATYHNNS